MNLGTSRTGPFERIKEPDTVHFEAADLLPHLAANPDLYPKLKGIVYALLKKRNGLDETYLVV